MRSCTLLLIIMIAAPLAAAQDLSLPEPGGQYAVGTTRLVLVDRGRPELFTASPDDHREIAIRVWYPADSDGKAHPAPYYEDAEEIVSRFGYPRALAPLETHAEFDVPVSDKQAEYPVILFNHGWGEHAVQNTVLMEELASRGYFVLSITHPYEAKFWVYPDGSLKFLDTWSPRFMEIMAEQNRPEMMSLFNAMFTTRGAAAQESLFRRTVEAMPIMLGETPRMWADDIRFVAGELDSLNHGKTAFDGKLDLENIGVMGMSMGGIAASQACIGQARIKAALNIDGGLFGDLPDTVVAQPTMFMGSRRFAGYDSVFARHVSGTAYTVIIRDADHYDFSDFTLLNRAHPMIGTVEGMRMLEIVNAYTLAFFDFYLKGEESDLLTGAGRPYAEVNFQAFNRP
jgi:predicted dienelactone hydrolase